MLWFYNLLSSKGLKRVSWWVLLVLHFWVMVKIFNMYSDLIHPFFTLYFFSVLLIVSSLLFWVCEWGFLAKTKRKVSEWVLTFGFYACAFFSVCFHLFLFVYFPLESSRVVIVYLLFFCVGGKGEGSEEGVSSGCNESTKSAKKAFKKALKKCLKHSNLKDKAKEKALKKVFKKAYKEGISEGMPQGVALKWAEMEVFNYM